MLGQQQSLFADIELPADVYCRGCRRTISTEKSLERGYGPTCWIHHLEDMLQNEQPPNSFRKVDSIYGRNERLKAEPSTQGR
jgi:hypothetical protein